MPALWSMSCPCGSSCDGTVIIEMGELLPGCRLLIGWRGRYAATLKEMLVNVTAGRSRCRPAASEACDLGFQHAHPCRELVACVKARPFGIIDAQQQAFRTQRYVKHCALPEVPICGRPLDPGTRRAVPGPHGRAEQLAGWVEHYVFTYTCQLIGIGLATHVGAPCR